MGHCCTCISIKPESASTLPQSIVPSNNHGRPLPVTPQILPPRNSRKTCQPSTTSTVQSAQVIQSTKKCVNILLLGESGVGKSTFINAIVNYFHFDTLAQATAADPITLMPVSFLISEGHDFDERLITFGDADPNEDHHHPGQSVTQHCRSYRFAISTHTTVRLIDTPGMGDTRGVEQDDHNMQHILSFISHLSHLDAICILLKPNLARLNVIFRSCLTRLLGFMGEGARNNVIFCFTNTRSTFFAPGDTGPLLKQMLASHPIRDIPCTKKNTFCFDSESFRYLIARRNGVRFDDYQEDEYEQSWNRSAMESRRLFAYICQDAQSYREEEWRSVEHARFKINLMIRPMLEAVRNVFRNMILQREQSASGTISLIPKMIASGSAICNNCDRTPHRYGDFWILHDDAHTLWDKCNKCACLPREHLGVDYELTYEVGNHTSRLSADQLKSDLKQVRRASVNFGRCLRGSSTMSGVKDPMLFYLNHMIAEETNICDQNGDQEANAILLVELNQFKEEYEQRINVPPTNHLPMNLEKTYEWINRIAHMDIIREQMNVINQHYQRHMNEQEKSIL
jgi:GTP-binding protein EngB required for normal cell division